MPPENLSLEKHPIRVSILNVTPWQRRIVNGHFYVDDRFTVIEPNQSEIQDTRASALDAQLRLIGFNSSRPGDDEVFIKLHNSAQKIPTIALMATAQTHGACKLPSRIHNRVLMPLESGEQPLSVAQFYTALLNAMEHSLPILGNANRFNSTNAISDAHQSIELVAIGSSTGGPKALQQLLPLLPQNLPVPIVITQHMPSNFTTSLARQLDRNCALSVSEAKNQEILKRGHVYIAPGDHHMSLRRLSAIDVCVEISDEAPVNFCRPSVDVLFKSAALVYGANCMAIVLTGMGVDGLAGSAALVETGAKILVQDESSSVVWGMPGSIASAGLASDVVHIDDLAGKLTSMLASRRAA